MTWSASGSSPTIVALPVAAFVPSDPALSLFTPPSAQGEYMFPSEAHEGYHVSAAVYSACRPVKAIPTTSSDGLNGQFAGDCDGQILLGWLCADSWATALVPHRIGHITAVKIMMNTVTDYLSRVCFSQRMYASLVRSSLRWLHQTPLTSVSGAFTLRIAARLVPPMVT